MYSVVTIGTDSWRKVLATSLIEGIKTELKCDYGPIISSSFSSDFESMFAWHVTRKILSFDFYPKAVYFEIR